MSNYNDGYKKVQRQYDNQMPPEDDSEECPECEGTGKISGQSNCCGAKCDDDILLCSECGEHCDLDECSECDGTGVIHPKALKAQAKAEWDEMKAEERRLEEREYEPRDREEFIEKNELSGEKE